MNTINNQRSKVTKIIFQNNLIELILQGRSIESITITEICKRSELNRGTFYSHYRFPKDILDEIETEAYQNFISYIEELKKTSGGEILIGLLKHIRSNSSHYQVLFQNGNSRFTEKIINSVLEELESLKPYIIDSPTTPYLYAYMIYGSEQLIIKWMNEDYAISEKKLSQMIYCLCKGAIEAFCSAT